MVQGVDALETAVLQAMKFEWSEVVRAKKAIKEMLSDGQPHGIRRIQRCLIEADGIPAEEQRDMLQMATAEDIEAVVTKVHPVIARKRLALVASDALLTLISQGIVVEVAESPIHTDGEPLIGPERTLAIRYQLGGNGATLQFPLMQPKFAHAYRLAPQYALESSEWFFDVDLFTADIEALELDRRTRRCISEALAAFRQGLFLASASLIGAASEGAWYAAGEQLRKHDSQLAKALDNGVISKVQSRVAEVLRQGGGDKSAIPELEAQAALLRQLRNYGVHPRPDEIDHLERYFSDSGAAILLLESYTYFKRLAAAVAIRLEYEQAN